MDAYDASINFLNILVSANPQFSSQNIKRNSFYLEKSAFVSLAKNSYSDASSFLTKANQL